MKYIFLIVSLLHTVLSYSQENNGNPTGKYIETMPEFPGGQQELMHYLQKSLRYPRIARELNVQGKVVTQFVINEDGSISDISILSSPGCGCDEEAIRVIQSMPKWKPGTQQGAPVKVYFKLPLVFKMSIDPDPNAGNRAASFPGGDKALYSYIKKHLRYPDEAKKNKIKGAVQIKFTVLKDGSTNNFEIVSSPGRGCGEEAVRVIRSMPPWLSAYKNCEAVEAEKTLIIHFPPK